MIRYPAAALVVLALALALTPVSHAAVDVVQTTEDGAESTLASFPTAKCRKATKKGALLKFIATARRGGWKLSVNVFRPGRSLNIQYGGDGPVDFTVTGPGGSFTNLNRPPDAPPGGGAIQFNAKKTRMGLGFSPAFNDDFSSSVAVAGGLKCQYPKKKRRR